MKITATMRKIGEIFFYMIFVAIFSMFAYDYFVVNEIGTVVRLFFPIIGGLVGCWAALFLGSSIIRGIINRKILANGIQAKARIIEVSETGERINNNPVLSILLEVHPEDESFFEATAERVVSITEVGRLYAGATVQVKYNPSTKKTAIMNA